MGGHAMRWTRTDYAIYLLASGRVANVEYDYPLPFLTATTADSESTVICSTASAARFKSCVFMCVIIF